MLESRAPGDRRAPGGRRGNTSSVVTLCHPACPTEALHPTSSTWAGDKSPGGRSKGSQDPRVRWGSPGQGEGSCPWPRPSGQARAGGQDRDVCLQPWLCAGDAGVPAGPWRRLLLPRRGGHGYCKEGLRCIPAPPAPTSLHPQSRSAP